MVKVCDALHAPGALIQATVSAAVVSNKELNLANKALWKSALALEKQIKHVLGVDRANAERLCKP